MYKEQADRRPHSYIAGRQQILMLYVLEKFIIFLFVIYVKKRIKLIQGRYRRG
jgi:hypothetical protein